MQWILDIKGQQYKQLLKELFSICDTVKCVMREDDPTFFKAIEHACKEKQPVTQWPLTSLGESAAPVFQYTFDFDFHTYTFLKESQPSLFSWLMPHPEDWSFWKDGVCIFATCSHEGLVDADTSVQQIIQKFEVVK